MRKLVIGVVSGLLLASAGAMAQRPAQNISAGRHPNLAAAQRACGSAYQSILQAQKSNEWDLGGHAQHAKDLLSQAADELKAAAETSNANGH
jgi:hypothetical protein